MEAPVIPGAPSCEKSIGPLSFYSPTSWSLAASFRPTSLGFLGAGSLARVTLEMPPGLAAVAPMLAG